MPVKWEGFGLLSFWRRHWDCWREKYLGLNGAEIHWCAGLSESWERWSLRSYWRRTCHFTFNKSRTWRICSQRQRSPLCIFYILSTC